METTGKKLSKSAGATSINYLHRNGMSPQDIFALIAQMAAMKPSVRDWEQLGAAVINFQE